MRLASTPRPLVKDVATETVSKLEANVWASDAVPSVTRDKVTVVVVTLVWTHLLLSKSRPKGVGECFCQRCSSRCIGIQAVRHLERHVNLKDDLRAPVTPAS